MANLSTNPWSFTNADQAASVAITSIVNKGASALVTTSGAHGLSVASKISIQGQTVVPGWNNGYRVLSVPSTTTFYIPVDPAKSALGNGGAVGNVLTAAYLDKIRIEQLVWQDATAAQLTITDTNGNVIWSQLPPSVGVTYTYGKLYWVDGIVINALPAGTLLATIN